jgi:outer membrane receptor protein involved in Fe transport
MRSTRSLIGPSILLPGLVLADDALEEVVVTAQRCVENLQDLPAAITAVSAHELAARGVRQAGDITASDPSMLLNSPYGPESQPSYEVFNARVTFNTIAKPELEVGAWIKNLANRQYLAYGLAQRNPADDGLGFDYALVGEPRTYGIDATYRF